MKEDLISVIIPAYNTGQYISNIIDAIKKQTYKNLEVIIVDDGSKDDTSKIASELLKDYDRPWQIIKKENGGLPSARNSGIGIASGEWIICPDSDDYIDPVMIETLHKVATLNNVQCAFCEYKKTYSDNILSGLVYNEGTNVYTRREIKRLYLARSIRWVIPSTLIHRSILKKIKFDVDCPHSEDTLFTWELIYQIDKVAFVASDMYNYFQREGSMIHSLAPENCLKAIVQYQKMVDRLLDNNPEDKKFIDNIVPKFILGVFHVLSRCTTYDVFKDTRKQISKNRIYPLFTEYKNPKLLIYAFLFMFSPKIFYRISR